MNQKRFLLILAGLLTLVLSGVASAQSNNPRLIKELGSSYNLWRNSIVKKDVRSWSAATAMNRQIAIRNRIYSERREFPKALFQLPATPPAITNLKALRAHKKGATATAVYFGKVNFNVGGELSDNILLLHFVRESGVWKYDTADFINLLALPKIRKQLQKGDLTYVEQEDFKASGVKPLMPIAVAPAEFVAKVYVFCPGREVRMKVNKISDHKFQDTKIAEVVIGGGKKGLNEVQFATKSLEGSTGKEALSIRVYLMSSVEGTKPLKVYEYQVNEGGKVEPFGSGNFTIDTRIAKIIKG